MPGFDVEQEEWRRSAEEREKAVNMTVAGFGMVLASILFGIVDFVAGKALRRATAQREEQLKHDYKSASQGKAEAIRMARESIGRPDRAEGILNAYRQYSETKDRAWVQGFWAGIPNPIKRYIEDQYEQHPETD